MGLITNKQKETQAGILLAATYTRLTITDNQDGGTIEILCREYVSKEAYKAGKEPIHAYSFAVAYNATTDGTDTRQFAHNKAKSWIVEQGIAAENEITIQL